MEWVDVVVIGGGVLGAFAARNLRRWRLETLLTCAEMDVCMGITRANSAIVYSGCDNKPGSFKAEMTVAANRNFAKLCDELAVPFKRCGSLLVADGSESEAVLHKKLKQGRENGVPDLCILSGEEARALEPMLAESVTAALLAPSSGTVNPWQLGIAAYENAVQNGCRAKMGCEVRQIRREKDGYVLETDAETFHCRAVVNAAGLAAAALQESCFPPSIRLALDAADYLVLDKNTPAPRHILFQECSNGKGVTVVPTVEGTLLLESPVRPLTGERWATSREGLTTLHHLAKVMLPELAVERQIRSFAAVRPNPYVVNSEKTRLHDFVIAAPAENFISLIGVKTPGLTCADALGNEVARRIATALGAELNENFSPSRKVLVQKDDEIVCQCEQISKGEILAAIARGAHTLDGVKHRTGSGLGRCQGSRCRAHIEALLEEAKHGTL